MAARARVPIEWSRGYRPKLVRGSGDAEASLGMQMADAGGRAPCALRRPIAPTLTVSHQLGNARDPDGVPMSTAFDLTASLSVPDCEMETGEAANGPGPQTQWSPPQETQGTGSELCDPPVQTLFAAAIRGECTGVGGIEATDAAGPMMPTGEPYPGDLLADILEYRRVRARVLGGGVLPQSLTGRHKTLEDHLGTVTGEDKGRGRAFHRFELRVPATLRLAQGRSVRVAAVGVDDISAGGVKLVGAGERVAGERVELLMDTADGRTVILPARVAWMQGPALGLMFAGAARWR